MKHIKSFSLVCSLMLLFICIPSYGASLAAHVILSKGVATATSEDGTARALKRRSKVFSGDIIKTGPRGSVQLRFVDKALMTIKASTEMDITSYLFNQQGDTSNKEQALMKLVKGGFRTISGKIGKGEKSAYKVDTPAASIGIRGTNYEVQQEPSGAIVMAVYSGGISVENDAGTLDLGLGSDFNFTRVTSGSSPVGLLEAPESLSVNAATDDSSEEESEEVAEGGDTEAASGEEGDDSEEDEDSGTVVAGGDSDDSSDGGSEEASSTQLALADLDGGVSETQEFIGDAITQKSVDEVEEENADQIVKAIEDAGLDSSDPTVIDAIASLQDTDLPIDEILDIVKFAEDNGLDVSDPNVVDNFEDAGGVEALEDAIADGTDLTEPDVIPDPVVDPDPDPDPVVDPNPLGLFDFNDAYADLDPVTNPLPTAIISDEQFNLASSDRLSMVVMPLNYDLDSDGRPTFNTLEAQISSPMGMELGSFTPFDYSAQDSSTGMSLNYQIFNTTTGELDEYEIQIDVDYNVAAIGDLETNIQDALQNGDFTKNGVSIASPGHVQLVLEAQTITDPGTNATIDVERFVFQPVTATDEFITEMELHFRQDGTPQSQQLVLQMGSDNQSNNDWQASVDIDVFIGTGSWNQADSTPILVIQEQHEQDGQIFDRTEVINKPGNSDKTVSSPTALALCADLGIVCDIQKDDVAAGINIRWGVWLGTKDSGISIYELSEDELGFTDSSTHQDEEILAFWLAAERADINNLTGTASFASTFSNCTDYGQCIGFADDGAVRSAVGQFDVNFDSGAITNGQLKLETAASEINDPDSLPVSTWDIGFSGQLTLDAEGNQIPEFQSGNVNGTVVDSNNILISDKIIGNVGGIFVRPGDVFAGGYNLGTADGTNKHAAGVFTLNKQP